MRSVYEIIGCPSDVTDEELRVAYRKATRRDHPDANGSTEQFQTLTEAWNLVNTTEKRRIYDASRISPKVGSFSGTRFQQDHFERMRQDINNAYRRTAEQTKVEYRYDGTRFTVIDPHALMDASEKTYREKAKNTLMAAAMTGDRTFEQHPWSALTAEQRVAAVAYHHMYHQTHFVLYNPKRMLLIAASIAVICGVLSNIVLDSSALMTAFHVGVGGLMSLMIIGLVSVLKHDHRIIPPRV